MSNIEQPEQTETMDIATAQRVEQEKMTRRAALRKLGFGAGMAAFALLGVDDFARMVGNRMERVAGDNKVVEQVAKEFQAMGVASADGPPYYYNPKCQHCCNQDSCDHAYCDATYNPGSAAYQACNQQASNNFSQCYSNNCGSGPPCTVPSACANPSPPFGWY